MPELYTPRSVKPSTTPPSIDPVAARRWQQLSLPHSPWLHEEVARRMEERLQWITLQPASWLHWQPLKGGTQAHALLQQRYPQATAWAIEPDAAPDVQSLLQQRLESSQGQSGWLERTLSRLRGQRLGTRTDAIAPGSIDMLWANMALHGAADPQALLAQWRSLLAVNGFLMFSTLGPDTLREIRDLYQRLGWPAPTHQFTDMHDWGDMLVQAGFAEPVMDMERITLSYSDASKLRAELRELGRNLHPARFAGLRGRQWLAQLDLSLERQLARADEGGRLVVTFEIIYGHAFKPTPRVKLEGEARISMQDMQQMLRQGRLPRE